MKTSIRRYALLEPITNLDRFWEDLQSYGWAALKQEEDERLSFVDEGPAPLSNLEISRPSEGSLLHFRACFDKRIPLDVGIRYDAVLVWEKENDRKITGDEREELYAAIQGKRQTKRTFVDCFIDTQTNYLLIDGTEKQAEDVYLAFFKATGIKARRETGILILRHADDFDVKDSPSTAGASLGRESSNAEERLAARFLAWCAGGYCPSVLPAGAMSLNDVRLGLGQDEKQRVSYSGKGCDGRADLALALLSPTTSFARGKFTLVSKNEDEPDAVEKGCTLTPTLEPASLDLITGDDEGRYSPAILEYWAMVGLLANAFKTYLYREMEHRREQAREAMQRVIKEASIYVRPTGQLTFWEEACTKTERIPQENGAELRERARQAQREAIENGQERAL